MSTKTSPQVKTIDLSPAYLNADMWRLCSWVPTHLTGHDHYMSPFETDDDCGNCSGAKCDYCSRISESPLEAKGIECDKLEQIIKELDPEISDDIVSDMVYNDCYNPRKSGYQLRWPSYESFKFDHPAKMVEILKGLDPEEEEQKKWVAEEIKALEEYIANQAKKAQIKP